MWLFTTQGFYSVVADRDDPDRVLVRARAREDIEALREQIPDLDPVADAGADYRWRAFVSRESWARAASELASEIDYDNFKNAVRDRQGSDRERRYHEIWHVMKKLQDDAAGEGRTGA